MIKRFLGATLGALAGCGQTGDSLQTTIGSRDDIDGYIDRLASSPDYGILIITVEGTGEFVQFSASDGAVQVDFPLVTSSQRARESAIRKFFEARGVSVVENRGSDGSTFLDAEFRSNPRLVAALTRAVLAEVFGAGEGARLRFESSGLGNAPQ
jgi:hypothetical protein